MRITLDSPLDMHLHLRDGDILKAVAPHTTNQFAGALIMPNLVPPITTIPMALDYKQRIINASNDKHFLPVMSLYLQEDFTDKLLCEAKEAGVNAIKLYPKGATTNSESGVSGIITEKTKRVFEIMQDLGMILCVHGETNGFVMDRESEFAPIYAELAEQFPKMKIIMEHISSIESCKNLDRYENLYATITAHHLLITLDDVVGGMINPHNFCKPLAKTPKDREALLELALDAHHKVSFGSDSAPHLQEKKECGCGAAGVFSAPILLPLLAELFEKHDKLHNLQKFVSHNARAIYGIHPPKKEVVLEKKEMIVPEMIGGVKCFMAGEKISWSLA